MCIYHPSSVLNTNSTVRATGLDDVWQYQITDLRFIRIQAMFSCAIPLILHTISLLVMESMTQAVWCPLRLCRECSNCGKRETLDIWPALRSNTHTTILFTKSYCIWSHFAACKPVCFSNCFDQQSSEQQRMSCWEQSPTCLDTACNSAF